MLTRPLAVALATILSVASISAAQSASATISGIITDSTGAVLPGVVVTAVNADTRQRTSATSNDRGFYALTLLPVGTYTIEAELAGFRTYRQAGLSLTTAATVAIDIRLSLGQLADSVTVSGEAPFTEARTSALGQLIEARTVQDVPLGDRRAMNLIKTTGAATFVNYDAGSKPNFSLAGGRTQSQMFWIDGGTGQNMRLGIGQVDIDPPVETIQEIRILTNNYSAEYGGSAGGVIIATTKSGTNQLRGSLFEYARNDAFDAANRFAPVEDGRNVKAPLRYNVFGGTAGGPIRRDATFFFVAYEGSRRRTGLTRTLTVPTPLQRAGDFSQTFDARGNLIAIYDPNTTRTESGRLVRTPFPGNRIPLDRLDPVAVKLLALYPAPNRPPDNVSGANNFTGNYVQRLTRDNYTVKIDQTLGVRDRLNGRYLYNSDNADFTSVFPERAADTLTPTLRHQHYFYIGYTRVLGASAVNELRYTYSTRINHQLSFGLGQPWPSRLGLAGVENDAFPRVSIAGIAPLGATTHERRQFPIQQHQIVDSLSWVRGRHALKVGVEMRPSFNFEVNRPSISGNFSFTTQPTGQPGVAGTGLGLASLLVGFPASFDVRETEALDRSSWYLAAFAQDDWTIGSSLTLNLGVRWETDTPIRDSNDRMNGFDPDAINPVSGTPGVVRFAGADGWPSAPYALDWNNVGPRFGLAWRPFGTSRSTVVRGGAGIFFAHPFDHGAPSSASLGFERSVSLRSPDSGITAPFYLRDGVPRVDQQSAARTASFGAVPRGRAATTNVSFFERNRATGYAQQFNAGIQHEVAGGIVVEASYLGNLSRKLPSSNLTLNQIPPERMGPASTQTDRPFPQFSDVVLLFPTLGSSNYHAGLLRVEKRFTRGFNLLATYTVSRFRNDTDEGAASLGETGVYSDYYNRRADYGPSANDIPHRFAASTVYELPIGPGQRYLSSGRCPFGRRDLHAVAVRAAHRRIRVPPARHGSPPGRCRFDYRARTDNAALGPEEGGIRHWRGRQVASRARADGRTGLERRDQAVTE
ncbi:MAG: hypothetical protein AUH43_19700 [Acidobacteria bacterium 13_1_40CM_65_14]|nr:MAG: hypothetical protein AUH43_19700 [Acidobacteria bacterium 13_1_40CM_65_14]